MKRKLISLALALAVLLSVSAPALAVGGSFSDIADESVARDVETLRLLGVIDGMGGGVFNPSGTLTRAQFCKMAVVMMGKGESEPAFRNRTIFFDVTSSHWARGYINLAASGEDAIIGGMGNGKFSPDTNISYAQAVTILVRLLGYSDSDTSMQWPEGYLSLADNIGLTKGVSIAANANITRAEAARLFCAMLACDMKDGSSYLSKFGSVTEDVVLLDNNAKAPDGTQGALFTSAGTFKTNMSIPDFYIGERGTLVVGADKKVSLFLPVDTTKKSVYVKTVEASWIKGEDGTRYALSSDTTVYTSSEVKKWGDVWLDIYENSEITVYFTANGTVEALYYATSDSGDNVAVAMNEVKGNPFASLVNGAADYTIYKNGAPASVSDIRRYDVAEYDAVAKRLRVNDFRLSGYYENAYPGQSSPEQIKVLGKTFKVLPAAQEELAKHKIGEVITLLFTEDMRVAGVVSNAGVTANAVGVVKESSSESITVELFTSAGSTLEISGKRSGSQNIAIGELVNVSSPKKDYLSAVRITSSNISGSLDFEKMTLGTTALSPSVKVFDRAGKSVPKKISIESITQEKISNGGVLYAHTDYAGRVDMLILNDVTGDCYTYGVLRVTTTVTEDEDGKESRMRTASIENSEGNTAAKRSGTMLRNGSVVGAVFSADGDSMERTVELIRLQNVSRSDFKTVNGETTLTVGNLTLPVSEDVQCYNGAAKEWFKTLNEARAFSSTLTVYYDRDPAQGGKVRVVVAE